MGFWVGRDRVYEYVCGTWLIVDSMSFQGLREERERKMEMCVCACFVQERIYLEAHVKFIY